MGGRVLEWGTILEIEGLGLFLDTGLTVMQNQSGLSALTDSEDPL
jgi:hypothetical protein